MNHRASAQIPQALGWRRGDGRAWRVVEFLLAKKRLTNGGESPPHECPRHGICRAPSVEGEEVGGGAREISFGGCASWLAWLARDGEGLALEFVLVRSRQEGASPSLAS